MLKQRMSKKVITITLIGILSISAILLARAPSAEAEIIFQAEKPVVPQEMRILEAVWQGNAKGRAREIASVFGVSGEVVKSIFDSWQVGDGSREVMVYEYGGFRYFDHHQMDRNTPPEDYLPDERCVEISNQFLEHLKACRLVSRSLELVVVDVAADGIEIYHEEGRTEIFWNNKHVNYALLYDGVPLYGGMAKCRVYLNEKGEVIGFFGDFWEVKPGKKVQILPPEKALLKYLPENASRAKVESIKLVYDVPSENAVFIVPSYVVTIEIETTDGAVVDFADIIPAYKK